MSISTKISQSSQKQKANIGIITKIIYLLFILLVFTNSNIRVGGIMLRYYTIIYLIIYCVYKNFQIRIDKTIVLFLCFLLCFGLSCFIKGYFDKFLIELYYVYIISIIGCLITMTLVKIDASLIRYITYCILCIGAFNVIVTYSQFTFNDDWFNLIADYFKLPISKTLEDVEYKSINLEVMDITLPGIFGNGVYNGYFLSMCAILSIVFVLKYNKIIYYIFPVFYLFGAFICQQRMPLLITLFILSIISLNNFGNLSKISKTIFVLLIIAGLIVFIPFIINASEHLGLRYSSTGFNSTGRIIIYKNTINYIASHPIIANIYELVELKDKMPHNLILNAYIYGGIVSFVIIVCILIAQFRKFLTIIRRAYNRFNVFHYLFAWSWAAYTLNGLAHNRSIVTGDFTIWLIWGILLSYTSVRAQK